MQGKIVPLVTAILVVAALIALVACIGQYPRTADSRAAVWGIAVIAAAVAGFSASWLNRKLRTAPFWYRMPASVAGGAACGALAAVLLYVALFTLYTLLAVALIAHSGLPG
jgi:hypothetical protein